jgi:hypothetical protein
MDLTSVYIFLVAGWNMARHIHSFEGEIAEL